MSYRKLSTLSNDELDAAQAAAEHKGYRFVVIGRYGHLIGAVEECEGGIPIADFFNQERERRASLEGHAE